MHGCPKSHTRDSPSPLARSSAPPHCSEGGGPGRGNPNNASRRRAFAHCKKFLFLFYTKKISGGENGMWCTIIFSSRLSLPRPPQTAGNVTRKLSTRFFTVAAKTLQFFQKNTPKKAGFSKKVEVFGNTVRKRSKNTKIYFTDPFALLFLT